MNLFKARDYQPSPFTQFYEKLKVDPAWTVKLAPCGHDVMVDRPDLLVEFLLDAV
jgi:hypothetical protein